jgi:glycosyltransferase involved in cell wall biosynthesis
MRRLLMVAYYFPPLGGIGSLRALKFATYLPELGWEVTVLAPRSGAYYRDPTLSFPEDRVIRTGSLELSRAGKAVLAPGTADTQAAAVGPLRRRVRDAVRRWVYRPDPQIGWYPFAVSAGRAALRDLRYDAMFSTSFPVTAHLVARRLRREFGVPWVAEFRDPWTELLPAGHPHREWGARLERAIADEAQAVVVPSPRWAELFRAKGARAVRVITNGYDPADLSRPEPPEGLVVTHVGTFYPGRQDLSAVWLALKQLRAEGPLQVRVRFVGNLPAAAENEVRAHGLGDVLEVSGFVPYREALARMAASSVLVGAGGGEPGASEGWIPAKLFEYLGTGLPVIYVGDTSSDAAALLRGQPGCSLVERGDVAGAREALLRARGERVGPRDLRAFTRRALAGRLAETLDRASA